jgi:hypothetical protein
MTLHYRTDAERRDTYRRNADFNSKSHQEEHRDAIRHDTHKPTPSVETTQNSKQAKKSLEKLYGTMLANLQVASRRRQKRPAYTSLRMRSDTTYLFPVTLHNEANTAYQLRRVCLC